MYCSIDFSSKEIKRLMLMAFIAVITSIHVYAQTRPKVSVQFVIEYDNYLTFYNNEPGLSVEMIEISGRDVLIRLLNREMPFIEFTQTTMQDQITFAMEGDLEIRIEPLLSLGTGEAFDADAFLFRDAINSIISAPPPNKDAFAIELSSKVAEWISVKKENIISDLFGNVRVCKSAVAVPQESSWVMPFKKEDLKIGPRSTLQVVTQVQGGLGTELCDYNTLAQGNVTTTLLGAGTVGKMFCKIDLATTNAACLEKMRNASIQGVYLKKFIPLAIDPSTSEDFDFVNQ